MAKKARIAISMTETEHATPIAMPRLMPGSGDSVSSGIYGVDDELEGDMVGAGLAVDAIVPKNTWLLTCIRVFDGS
jgi:hypothetical protein